MLRVSCKKYCFLLVLVLSLLVLPVLSSAATFRLTLADSTAPVGLRGEGVKIFTEEVEKHTNGKVKVDVHWGGSLLKAKEILNGIQDGIVDIGFINPNYYPQQMIATSAFALFPKGPKKFTNMYSFYKKSFEEIDEIKSEFKKLGIKPIYINTSLPMSIVSTKPFTSIDSFSGKQVRAASRWWLAQLKGANAIPVSIPWSDCYMALQTGTIDAVYTNRDGEHRTKLDEVAKHVYTMRDLWIGVPFIYAINMNKWNSFPPEIQTQIVAAGESAAKRFEELHNNEWNRIEKNQKEMGCTITEASSADIEKWINMPANEQSREDWIKETESSGHKDARQALSKMKSFLAEAIERENI